MRHVRLRLRLALATFVAASVLAVTLTPVAAASTFEYDLYFADGYERQIDSRTCVAASVAMMLNMVARTDLGLSQPTILRYAQEHDALNDDVQRGSDPLGWSRALTHYSTTTGKGPFTYRWETRGTELDALRRAAYQLRLWKRPVGLLVQNGRHAVVMTGFEATADPLRSAYRLIAVWVSDPYGNSHRRYLTADSPLNKYLQLDATKTYDDAWYGKYVIVSPIS